MNDLKSGIDAMVKEVTNPVNKTIRYGFDDLSGDKDLLFRDKANQLGGFNIGENIPDGKGFGGVQYDVSAPYNHKHWNELDKYAKSLNTAYTQQDLARLKEIKSNPDLLDRLNLVEGKEYIKNGKPFIFKSKYKYPNEQ